MQIASHSRLSVACNRAVIVRVQIVYPLVLTNGHQHQNGDVVCRECPNHGRESKAQDFSQSPVVEKDGDGNLVIVKQGIVRGY
jgi:hypothetical protein